MPITDEWQKCIYDNKIFPKYTCSTTDCEKCGWNPKVNQSRRNEIRLLAAQGRISEWGKAVEHDEE